MAEILFFPDFFSLPAACYARTGSMYVSSGKKTFSLASIDSWEKIFRSRSTYIAGDKLSSSKFPPRSCGDLSKSGVVSAQCRRAVMDGKIWKISNRRLFALAAIVRPKWRPGSGCDGHSSARRRESKGGPTAVEWYPRRGLFLCTKMPNFVRSGSSTLFSNLSPHAVLAALFLLTVPSHKISSHG